MNNIEHVRIKTGILAILFGGYGIHKYYTGRTKQATVMLAITLLGFINCMGPIVMTIIGVCEGIRYLLMDDDDFSQTYLVELKPWF